MLREIDLEKNSLLDIKVVLNYIANELEKDCNSIISFIKETKEYYSDGVDEELIDMIEGVNNEDND